MSYDATSHDTLSRSSSACGRDEIPSSEPVVKGTWNGDRSGDTNDGRFSGMDEESQFIDHLFAFDEPSDTICAQASAHAPLPVSNDASSGAVQDVARPANEPSLPVEATELAATRPIASMLPPTRN